MEPGLSFLIRLTCETSTVMPRSLKLPVWLLPHCLTHRSDMPSDSRPNRSAQNRLLLPSNMLTTSSLSNPARKTKRRRHRNIAHAA